MPQTQNPSQEIQRLIDPKVLEFLRQTIVEAEGNEVFFVGVVDKDGIVRNAEAAAYGNQDAVPVIESLAQPGDVILHNHPGGDLTPSSADLSVSSMLGNKGVGSYIIDNEASRIRVVVKAMPPRERRPLDLHALEQLLNPDSRLARSMARYEERPEQRQMLGRVVDAFNQQGIAVIEAGTGTGKSLAYLLPAAHWAVANRQKVVVSTNTINLQEQLIRKDIPFLQRQLGIEFKAEMLKGQGNYLCLRKAEYLRTHPDFFDDPRAEGEIGEILNWAKSTSDGSLGDLSFIPEGDTWERVRVDGDDCTRIKCPHYNDCFFFQARRRAAAADIVVANHHLVMADLAVREETGNYQVAAVLPPFQHLVLDEAHNVEDVATRYFGIRITRQALARSLNRLVHRERSNIGLLPFILNRVSVEAFKNPMPGFEELRKLVNDELIPLRMEVADTLRRLMDDCAVGVAEELRQPLAPRRELRLRIVDSVEQGRFWAVTLREHVNQVSEQMLRLAQGLSRLNGLLSKLTGKARQELQDPATECRALSAKLTSRANEFRNFYNLGENYCRWIEVYLGREGGSPVVRLISLPLEVQPRLARAVHSKIQTIVMTSATLAVNKRFDFFRQQIGLSNDFAESDLLERVEDLQLDTPFDYTRQAFVGIPHDLPEPSSREFSAAACDFLLHALEASRGAAFLLFTSYQQLRQFFDRMSPTLRSLGYSCLRQGDENRQALLQRFRNDRTSILFATSSFWEGVDVPGDALRLLALVKLPFRVPTDPLVEARAERLEAQGRDAFREYSLPQAVIRFKQGFGRLIRTREDRGAVLVLDRRIVTKSYGQVFLNSLPDATIHRKTSAELIGDLHDFFEASHGD